MKKVLLWVIVLVTLVICGKGIIFAKDYDSSFNEEPSYAWKKAPSNKKEGYVSIGSKDPVESKYWYTFKYLKIIDYYDYAVKDKITLEHHQSSPLHYARTVNDNIQFEVRKSTSDSHTVGVQLEIPLTKSIKATGQYSRTWTNSTGESFTVQAFPTEDMIPGYIVYTVFKSRTTLMEIHKRNFQNRKNIFGKIYWDYTSDPFEFDYYNVDLGYLGTLLNYNEPFTDPDYFIEQGILNGEFTSVDIEQLTDD